MGTYAVKFNIISTLDIDTLNKRIDACARDYGRDIYIFMSPKTVNELSKANASHIIVTADLSLDECSTSRRLFGLYRGCKVFEDPTMNYGDVEIR